MSFAAGVIVGVMLGIAYNLWDTKQATRALEQAVVDRNKAIAAMASAAKHWQKSVEAEQEAARHLDEWRKVEAATMQRLATAEAMLSEARKLYDEMKPAK